MPLITLRETETNELIVEVASNGEITYGPNYNPDDAARKFWTAIGTIGYEMVTCKAPVKENTIQ